MQIRSLVHGPNGRLGEEVVWQGGRRTAEGSGGRKGRRGKARVRHQRHS